MFDEVGMYHESNNLFFGRKACGSVRILKFADDHVFADGEWPTADGENPDAILDQTVPDGPWCSAVCAVSRAGATGSRWEQALNFHNR